MNLQKIISGGQTGVDRGALDAAIRAGIPHGGWCPNGRRAEDGVIPSRYALAETDSTEYRLRTERNILESDGTLILATGALRGGTKLTARLAKAHGKPLLIVDLSATDDIDPALAWISDASIRVLNVAGPRESQSPGITAQAADFVHRLLGS